MGLNSKFEGTRRPKLKNGQLTTFWMLGAVALPISGLYPSPYYYWSTRIMLSEYLLIRVTSDKVVFSLLIVVTA